MAFFKGFDKPSFHPQRLRIGVCKTIMAGRLLYFVAFRNIQEAEAGSGPGICNGADFKPLWIVFRRIFLTCIYPQEDAKPGSLRAFCRSAHPLGLFMITDSLGAARIAALK